MLLLMLLLDQLLLLVANNADINVINIVDAVFRLELHTADRADLDDVVLDVANEQLHGFTGTERLVANGTQAIHRDAGCIFEPAAAQILPYFSVFKTRGQGQSGQAIKLFPITPYVNDFQTPKHL